MPLRSQGKPASNCLVEIVAAALVLGAALVACAGQPGAPAAPLPPTLQVGAATAEVTATTSPAAPTAVLPKLTVEEYAIAARGVYTPGALEYMQLIPREVLERRMQTRNLPPDEVVKPANEVLARFGYRLAHDPPMSSYTYLLFKGGQQILSGIQAFRPPTANARGDDFVMWLIAGDGGEKLLRASGVTEWRPVAQPALPPVYVGNDLITAYYEGGLVPPAGQAVVQKNGQSVFSTEAEFMVDNPLKSLWSWEGHWVLEVQGKVIVDGQSLNAQQGYGEAFEWRLIRGQPFYFFEKNGRFGVSYAGQVLPQAYDEVMHYGCCEPAAFDPRSTDDMIWFHARRGDKWYYVEMGVYD